MRWAEPVLEWVESMLISGVSSEVGRANADVCGIDAV